MGRFCIERVMLTGMSLHWSFIENPVHLIQGYMPEQMPTLITANNTEVQWFYTAVGLSAVI